MSVSASEIERLESPRRKAVRTRYTEEYRLEAVEYYRKAKEIDPKKTIIDCARELGVSATVVATRWDCGGELGPKVLCR